MLFSQREILLLKAIGDNAEMIMSDLAAEIEAPLSTVTRMVDRLEAKGFLERSRSEKDRRIVVVRLSGGKGKVLLDAFLKFRQEMARRMLEPLSLGEREILLELMGKMVASLNEAQPAR